MSDLGRKPWVRGVRGIKIKPQNDQKSNIKLEDAQVLQPRAEPIKPRYLETQESDLAIGRELFKKV